jgi:hypothetical protein
MQEPDGLRASDDDRERAAADIREHFALGRLTSDELSERLDRAYAARTTAELQALRADLPALPPSARSSAAELAARRSELTRHLVQRTGAALVPFLICTLVWLVSGASGSFWPAWALVIAAIPLVRNGWRLYGPAPDLEGVAKDLTERPRHPSRRGPSHRRP